MNRTLFLYSVMYPFGVRGGFIKNELPGLMKCIQNIRVLPLYSESREQQLPNGVKKLMPFSERRPSRLTFRQWRELMSILFYEFRRLNLSRKWIFIRRFRTLVATLKVALVRSYELEKNPEWKNACRNSGSIHYSFWFMEWALVLSILKRRGVISGFVSRSHGTDLYDERWEGNYMPFRYFLMNSVDFIYTVSEFGDTYLRSRYPEFSGKVVLFKLGTPRPVGFPVKSDDHRFTIVTCSNIIGLKRLYRIPEVLSRFSQPIKWVHFGDGSGEDLRLFMSKVASLPSSVSFEYRGRVLNEEIHKFYSTSFVDLTILLSESEGGVPVSLQESASYGIPMIGTEAGGIPEIINDETGILLPLEFTDEHLYDAINEILSERKNFDCRKIQEFSNQNFDSLKNSLAFANHLLNSAKY